MMRKKCLLLLLCAYMCSRLTSIHFWASWNAGSGVASADSPWSSWAFEAESFPGLAISLPKKSVLARGHWKPRWDIQRSTNRPVCLLQIIRRNSGHVLQYAELERSRRNTLRFSSAQQHCRWTARTTTLDAIRVRTPMLKISTKKTPEVYVQPMR